MNERWITIKGRGPVKIKSTSEYMNDLIRNKQNVKLQKEKKKEFTRADLIKGKPYKGADGYWNIDLKEGYVDDSGWSYIWERTKKEAYDRLDMLVRAENNWRKNKEE